MTLKIPLWPLVVAAGGWALWRLHRKVDDIMAAVKVTQEDVDELTAAVETIGAAVEEGVAEIEAIKAELDQINNSTPEVDLTPISARLGAAASTLRAAKRPPVAPIE